MIDRTALTGTFPDPATCLVVCATCVGVALVLVVLAVRSWLKGE